MQKSFCQLLSASANTTPGAPRSLHAVLGITACPAQPCSRGARKHPTRGANAGRGKHNASIQRKMHVTGWHLALVVSLYSPLRLTAHALPRRLLDNKIDVDQSTLRRSPAARGNITRLSRWGDKRVRAFFKAALLLLDYTIPRSGLAEASLHPTAVEVRKPLCVKARPGNLQMRQEQDVTAYHLQMKICSLTYPGQITLVKDSVFIDLLCWSVCTGRSNQSAAAEATCSSSARALRS